MKRRMVIADEADVMLVGIQTILHTNPLCEITASARGASELFSACQSLQPDIILFNERLDALVDVLTLVERLKQTSPRSRQMVIGSVVEGLLIRDLFACGVLAYLFIGDDLQAQLPQAIQMVSRNCPYLSPTANSAYLVAMQSPLRDWHLDSETRALLRLLMQGAHLSAIAQQLNIPMRRAYFLRNKLKRRFGATTNEHLISRAIAEGFSPTDA